jgi:hypothetical protein
MTSLKKMVAFMRMVIFKSGLMLAKKKYYFGFEMMNFILLTAFVLGQMMTPRFGMRVRHNHTIHKGLAGPGHFSFGIVWC